MRTDIQLVKIEPAPDDDTILLVDAKYYTKGRRVRSEVRIGGWLQKTCREILDSWFGEFTETPIQRQGRSPRLIALREKYFNNTPEAVFGLTKTPGGVSGGGPEPKRSKFVWKEEPGEHTKPGGAVLPTTIPENPVEAGHKDGEQRIITDDRYHYRDPTTNQIKPMLSRDTMIGLKMTKEQRHEQYRRQGGKHPDDE